jgi:hypothetical protein
MEKTIELSREYAIGGLKFKTVTLREPTYFDVYMAGLGKPFEWQFTPAGSPMRVVIPEVVAGYVSRIALSPPADCIREISAFDAVKLEDAICGFFTEPVKTPDSPQSTSSSLQDLMQQQLVE